MSYKQQGGNNGKVGRKGSFEWAEKQNMVSRELGYIGYISI